MKYLHKCTDECKMYLVESKNPTPHYGSLRCRKHGFIKWLSKDQYAELMDIMYPVAYASDLLK